MISRKWGNVVSILTIVYGVINFVANLDNPFLGEVNVFGMLFSIGIIIVGIVSIVSLNMGNAIKGLMITMIVIWFTIAASVFFLFVSFSMIMPELAIAILFIGAPLVTISLIGGFKYLESLKVAHIVALRRRKEALEIEKQRQLESIQNKTIDDITSDDLVSKLDNIKQLLNSGHITEE